MRRANDPAWLEQQYDNRARVPDHARLQATARAAGLDVDGALGEPRR